MDVRLQTINNDNVLELTDTVVKKTHHSETDLLRKKTYFEGLISKGQQGLDDVNAILAQINNEKRKL